MNESEHRRKAYPTLGQAWGLLGYIILATVVFMLLVFAVYFIFLFTGDEAGATRLLTGPLSKLIMYTVPFIVVVWLALKRKRRSEVDYRLDFSAPSGPGILLIALTTWSIYFLVDPVVDLIPMPDFFKEILVELLSDHSLPAILMLVVAAPICEELLFRGIILDGLLKNYSPRKAIVWSAVLFGVVHLNPWQFLPALALGVFMGWVFYRTGSLLATMIIHFVANSTGVMLGWLLVPDPSTMMTTREMVGRDALYFALLALDVAALALFVVLLKKHFETVKEAS